MKPPSSKLQHEQQQETVETQKSELKTVAHEFQSPEQALRADAAQTEVPESVKVRLTESVQKEPKPPSWWQRLLR